jgi:GH24 family phage-related lysozyme (muramidase)
MNDTLNKSVIARHEGERLQKYTDTRGRLTIARGFNLDAPGAPGICASLGIDYQAIRNGALLTQAQCDAIFNTQYATVASEARHIFPAIDTYAQNAAAVVCDMLFQLGFVGFLAFRHFIAAVGTFDWTLAVAELRDSYLAQEVPNRVNDNISLLEAISA